MKIDIVIRDCELSSLSLVAQALGRLAEVTATAEKPTQSLTSTNADSFNPPGAPSIFSQSYEDGLAASVFAKQGAIPNGQPQGPESAPQQPAATAQNSTPAQPAQSAVSGTPGGASSVELDEEGYPWDARIHNKNKSRVVKGNTWKLIRGVDPALVAKVRAEWNAQRGQQTAHEHTQAQPTGTVVKDGVTYAPLPQTQPGYVPPQAQGTYTPPPAQDPYGLLQGKITKAIADGKVQPAVVASMLNYYGIKDLADLRNFPQQFDMIGSEVDRLAAQSQQ